MDLLKQYTEVPDNRLLHRCWGGSYEILFKNDYRCLYNSVVTDEFIDKYGVRIDGMSMRTDHDLEFIMEKVKLLYGFDDENVDYKPLFDRTDISDFKIVCTDGEIPAHKMVLMDKCKFFLDYIGDTDADEIKVDYQKKFILPLIRCIYGFVNEVRYKFELMAPAQIFQLSIEKYILTELQGRDAEQFLNRLCNLDSMVVNLIKNTAVRWMLKHIELGRSLDRYTKDRPIIKNLCNIPLPILKEYLSSDFLDVYAELDILRFLYRYKDMTGNCPVENGLIKCVRPNHVKLVGKSSKFLTEFQDVLPTLPTIDKRRISTKLTKSNLLYYISDISEQIVYGKVTIREYIGTQERLDLLNYVSDNDFVFPDE